MRTIANHMTRIACVMGLLISPLVDSSLLFASTAHNPPLQEPPSISRQYSAKSRPKVALVLAGGGAKGLAHIGAIKVLEEAGIPIDIVVGNSMGSIVGGLYAIGYTPHEMDSVVRHTDWMQLLLDAPDYGKNEFATRRRSETYQLRVSLNPDRQYSKTGKGGLIQGRNIEYLLRQLTCTIPDSVDFDKLPLPFACNATEVTKGSIHEFHEGDLVKAMRASMAIPGIFTPVEQDSMLFVDGFVTNNYPVDVAKRMGADIIIGCDLVSCTPLSERYNSLMDLVTHMIDISSTHKYEENIRRSDIYIDIDVTEYNSASFGSTDIDSLITRGERRARQLLPQIESLRDDLNKRYGTGPLAYKEAQATRHAALKDGQFRQKQIEATIVNGDSSLQKKGFFRQVRSNYLKSSLNMGARFDNDEYASVHFEIRMVIPNRRQYLAILYGRLGERLCGGLEIRRNLSDNTHIGLRYNLQHSDQQYYRYGNRAASVTSNRQRTQLYFAQQWQHGIWTMGLKYHWHYYSDALSRADYFALMEQMEGKKDRYLSYFLQAEYNTLDSHYYPTHGSRVHGRAELITGNFYQFEGSNAVPIIQLSWKSAFTIGERFTVIPHTSGRLIINSDSNIPFTLSHVVGGLMEGMKEEHQLTMAGLSDLEVFSSNAFASSGLGLQLRMGDRHFLHGAIDGGSYGSQLESFFNPKDFTWGTQLGYAYSSMAGPISLTGYWSERTKRFNLMFNVGYYF